VVERIAHGWKISMVYLCISYMIMLGIRWDIMITMVILWDSTRIFIGFYGDLC
jgi:hypothetical protein